ncbi:MAG: radical SAM protein [Methanothrix sp.]|nr:radical SAM protein [Methanothrix sp.]
MTLPGQDPYLESVSASKHNIWKGRGPLLGRLDMELTERCNNDCIHCCINLPEDDPARCQEMPTERVKAILSEAASLGCLTVRFTGGEPLLRKDFAELYIFSRRLGMRVMLFTNACLINAEIADLLSRVPPRELVEVSVYGMTRESYEAVTRSRGSYEQFLRGIALLQERKIPFVVKGALLPKNRKEMVQFKKWAATIPYMKKPPRYSMFFDLRCRRDSPAKNRIIKSLRASPEEGTAIQFADRDEYLKEMKQFCNKFMRPPGELLFSCGAGHGACVDAYGILQPCMMLRHPDAVYDLEKGSLQKALTEFFPRMREMKATNPDYLARCARCFLKGLCEQCPAKSWMEHGTLDTPVEYLCRVAHAKAMDIGLLKEGENAWEVERWRERIRSLLENSI